MGAITSMVGRLFASKFSTLAARQVIYPLTGAGAGTGLGAVCTSGAALTFGAWQDIALPALITVENWAVAVIIDTPSILEQYEVQIGSTFSLGVVYANAAAVTAAGALAIAGAVRATAVRQQYIAIAAILGPSVFPLAVPVWYGQGHGIIARISTISGADTLNVSAVCATGI